VASQTEVTFFSLARRAVIRSWPPAFKGPAAICLRPISLRLKKYRRRKTQGKTEISGLRPLDETKIETEQKRMKWTVERPALILGCFDKSGPRQKHQNICEIKIEQDPG
jgi:hypothetical protein